MCLNVLFFLVCVCVCVRETVTKHKIKITVSTQHSLIAEVPMYRAANWQVETHPLSNIKPKNKVLAKEHFSFPHRVLGRNEQRPV